MKYNDFLFGYLKFVLKKKTNIFLFEFVSFR